jgi:hypothetical protein
VKAFIEPLCDHAGIVRAGPQCEKYGDPFDYAIAFVIDGKFAIIKGLVADGGLTSAHRRACFKALWDVGLIAKWERIK